MSVYLGSGVSCMDAQFALNAYRNILVGLVEEKSVKASYQWVRRMLFFGLFFGVQCICVYFVKYLEYNVFVC